MGRAALLAGLGTQGHRGLPHGSVGGRNCAQDAKDPFNDGHTPQEVETRIACAAEGLDPDLGYLHLDERLCESFVYDLLEPLRVQVDRLTLEWTRAVGERRPRGLRPWMFIELRDGVMRLDPDAARDYAHMVMPRLQTPARKVAADFAVLRRVTIPYRLTLERVARKKEGTRVGVGAPCGYCGNPVQKLGLKFCGRTCYLRHSVEVAQPIKKAQARLAQMRAVGLDPGHGGEAAKRRGAALAENNRRRVSGRGRSRKSSSE